MQLLYKSNLLQQYYYQKNSQAFYLVLRKIKKNRAISMILFDGQLKKMRVFHNDPIKYQLEYEKQELNVNDLIGAEIHIQFGGKINCIKCGRSIKKTYGQGFCYPCFRDAPEAAECIIKPELCRAHLGEGRDVEWEEKHHNQPHIVYLANSSTTKVGVTRKTNVPNRWIDQGASSAIILAETPNRYEAGRIEVAMKSIFADKTNWRKMLSEQVPFDQDLIETKWELEEQLPEDITQFFTDDEEVIENHFPVNAFPEKIKSINLLKQNEIRLPLQGIKGQYLIFTNGFVMNIRNHTGFFITLSK